MGRRRCNTKESDGEKVKIQVKWGLIFYESENNRGERKARREKIIENRLSGLGGELGNSIMAGTKNQLWGKSFILLSVCGLALLNASVVSGKPISGEKACSSKALRSMARVYMAYGDYAKAQPFAEQALSLARTTDACDSELCSCLIDLAYLYNNQGKPADAEEMCKLGLKLQEKVYFKKHPYVAYTLRILSSIYQGQGKYRQARPDPHTFLCLTKASGFTDRKPFCALRDNVLVLRCAQVLTAFWGGCFAAGAVLPT